ncbi:hypothetical protein cce_2530 [Crocosphaera subtropica ATCC 51142]|uniref:N-acetyltransferase domain-containing protein n=1 Tax=Crocosphaera subtropica (strain ATCC 51142 / BH68) TaxID=43989 RepID=B1WS92_CROS5|nr:GNAT family N-acetyltransferase [Crocosphaera subtropica]ACB51878.1 hypothetical protein cce_2530 [Crocosphaera subtropica ATCC 51142]
MDNRFFSKTLNKADSKQHLDSHYLLIRDFQGFLQPFNLPLLADKFMAMIRFRGLEVAGLKSSLEKLYIKFHPPDSFEVKMTFKNSEKIVIEEDTFSLKAILNWSISHEVVMRTKRLEISFLLASDEPEVINFLQDSTVWKMRGERYTPIMNIHSTYKNDSSQVPWYKYCFAVRLNTNKNTIGFISFYELSQINLLDLITPVIGQTFEKPVMISYGLSKDYWGKKIMSEAVCSFVPWFIEHQNVKELIAFSEINNFGSRRILEKLKLKNYGVLKTAHISNDLKDSYKFMVYKK